MINDVILEGVVVRTWHFAGDLLFRLACARDPDLPAKLQPRSAYSTDYVTIRVLQGNLGAPVAVEKGALLRVHGFLQSRDYDESLVDFLEDVRGEKPSLPEELKPELLRAPRTTTEIIARRIMLCGNGEL